MGRRRKEQASQDVVEVADTEAVDAAVAFLEEVEAEAPAGCMGDVEEAHAYEEPAPIANPSAWVVLEDTVVSLFGQMTTLPAGTLVSAASYGPIGIKRIMEQGVALEPVA